MATKADTPRDTVVRNHFEAMRDLEWAEFLEPRFKEAGATAEELELHRLSWIQHADRRDWAWWQEEAERYTTAEIQAMLESSREKLHVLGDRGAGKGNIATVQNSIEENSVEKRRDPDLPNARETPSR